MTRLARVIRTGLGACVFVFTCFTRDAVGENLPLKDGFPYLPDRYLIAERALPWAYRVTASPTPVRLAERSPTAGEQEIIDRARTLLARHEAKAIALLDGPNIVHVEFNLPASADSLFLGASIAKTMTSLAVAQAICAGKMGLEDRADKWIPELRGKALGRATTRDLLRMASGAADPINPQCPSCGAVFSASDWKEWTDGTLDIVKVISSDRLASAARGMFSEYRPGEAFSYKGTDPLVLGLMVSAATGMPYAQWAQRAVLDPMGVAGPGTVAQNRNRQALTDQGVRLRMFDWMRFAWWVRKSAKDPGCFGDYVREASRMQIANGASPSQRRTGGSFAGYGYLIWTNNSQVPNAYWALGLGGQRIGWNTENDRMIIVFSNHENWMSEIYKLYGDWIKLTP